MDEVCCPAKSVAMSRPVISSSVSALPPYTCTEVRRKLQKVHGHREVC